MTTVRSRHGAQHRSRELAREKLRGPFSDRDNPTGAELQHLIQEIGWNGTAFAAHIGVSDQTVSNWVRGRHPIPRLAVLYLECLVEAFDERAAE